MAEITELMGARASALTSHPENGSRAQAVFVQNHHIVGDDLIKKVLDEHILGNRFGDEGRLRWIIQDEIDTCCDILLVPVSKVDGHSRLLISVFFDQLSPDTRRHAEAIYEKRAPFAIGYFRLWQLNRSRERSIFALQSALHSSGLGVILLNRNSEIVFANAVAEGMLDRGDGIRRFDRKLRTRELSDGVRLQVAIEHVIAAGTEWSPRPDGHRHAPLLSVRRHDAASLMVSVLPTDTMPEEPDDVAAIIYVMDPSREVRDLLKPVCKVYHLSPVETQLACHLVGGETLSQAATKMHVKDMTARSYLKQIFLKTDTHRQSELMQLMLSSIIQTNPEIVPEPF